MKINKYFGRYTVVPYVILFIYNIVVSVLGIGCAGNDNITLPGKNSDGRILLPNGWFLSPAGKEIEVGDTPLNFDTDPSGRYTVVTNNGVSDQTISIVDLKSSEVTQTIPVSKSWLGIKYFDKGNKFVLSGGNENRLYLFSFAQGTAQLVDSIVIGKPWPDEKIWLGGLDLDEPAGRLFVTGRYDSSLNIIDLSSKARINRIDLHGVPYTCVVSRNHPYLYVSMWGNASILVFDRESLNLLDTITVGAHPNDMVESNDGKRLFVANANENTVSVIDLDRRKVAETICSALFPDMPPGSTPNSVALSPDNKTLYIANADNNYLAVMDISEPGESKSLGFIPVGWYPSCVRVNPVNGDIIVANVKGNTPLANPDGPQPGKRNPNAQYIGSLFKGTLEIISPPDLQAMAKYSQQVYANTLYKGRDTSQTHIDAKSLFAPIKHVFYVLKENRTYDQVFGDMKEGNGDPSLVLFGERITPNIHALARQFVLLDNFYVDAEVSADGHNWSMAAYATDYIEKSWPTQYGGWGADYDFEGESYVGRPSSGYIWDNCLRHNVSLRVYGEFVNTPDSIGALMTPRVPSLEGHICPTYRGWDLNYSDLEREKVWEKEFDEFEKNGELPAFNIVYLPNDHTSGSSKGALTPAAMVAQNDLAFGRFIERLSHSRYWKESAVFVLEDDAQNGPDHVDAHRSTALVISPYTKHGYVDHTLYSTSGMIRTIEMILGLPPMTQFDASATPMTNSFTAEGVFTPFTHLPANVDLEERNLASAYGAEKSGQMDFSEPDRIDEQALNEILWKIMKGVNSEVPPPRRGAFVKTVMSVE